LVSVRFATIACHEEWSVVEKFPRAVTLWELSLDYASSSFKDLEWHKEKKHQHRHRRPLLSELLASIRLGKRYLHR
jgi:hypothetical protein